MLIINLNLKDLPEIMYLALFICLLLLCFLKIKRMTSCEVYLIDFACYKPPKSQKCTRDDAIKQATKGGLFSQELLDFMRKTMERSGLGDATYLPDTFFKDNYIAGLKDSRREVEMTIFSSIDTILAKTGVKCEDIGILIVNCCIFSTAPSLSSMIVNRYKFRENVITYNLTGMGCSAGLLATGLAKKLLQVHQNTYAMVVSTESITENCYIGEDRSKLIANSLFRVGGAAVLLSSHPSDQKISKYELLHAIHNNTSSSDRSYNCIFRGEDNAGLVGVTINRDLLFAAIATIEPNLTTIGSLILPKKDKLLSMIKKIARKLLPVMKIQPQKVNYSDAVDHFIPHVGGRPVLDELQRTLGFSDGVMEASRMTLYRYGNTSSSSIWYALAYVEAKGRVKKGNRVWQISFGAGFKCNSIILRAMKSVDRDDKNPWTDEIAGFPVTIEDCEQAPFSFEPSK